MFKSKIKKMIAIGVICLTSLSIFSTTSYAYDKKETERYFGGNITTGLNRPAWYDSSVKSYGYTSHFDTAREYWNRMPGINIWKWDKANNSTDRYYVGTKHPRDTTGKIAIYGQQTPYKIVNGKAVEVKNYNEDYNYSVVTIYHNAISEDKLSRSVVNLTAAHEVGHSLKLKHTPRIAIEGEKGKYVYLEYIPSVMRQDNYGLYMPMFRYDLTSVGEKWGY